MRAEERRSLVASLCSAARGGLVLAALALALAPTSARATWSVLAVDRESGRLIAASATCVPQHRIREIPSEGLMDIQTVMVPGVGVAVAQAGVDESRANQRLIERELERGTHPERIVDLLREDPEIERRQYGILDVLGRSASFSGRDSGLASLATVGTVPGAQIAFAIQGNSLASEAVIREAAAAFLRAQGDLTDRVMAAMEAADQAGGDRRCTCETEPVPDARCDGKTAHVAYLAATDPEGVGDVPAVGDHGHALFLEVTDENILPHENANPVITLRMRYDEWKAGSRQARALPNELHYQEAP